MAQVRQSKSVGDVGETHAGSHPSKPVIASSLAYVSGNGTPPSSTVAAGELANYKALITRAADVFGDDRRASLWLSTPSRDLGGQVPLKIAKEDGYSLHRLEPIFVRLEHGIDF